MERIGRNARVIFFLLFLYFSFFFFSIRLLIRSILFVASKRPTPSLYAPFPSYFAYLLYFTLRLVPLDFHSVCFFSFYFDAFCELFRISFRFCAMRSVPVVFFTETRVRIECVYRVSLFETLIERLFDSSTLILTAFHRDSMKRACKYI